MSTAELGRNKELYSTESASQKYGTSHQPDTGLAFVLPYLAFGAHEVAQNEDLLNYYGITHIINLVSSICENKFPTRYQYLSLDLLDTTEYNISEDIVKSRFFIDQVALTENAKCFVHCMAGRSRSAAIVIGYLIQSKEIPFEEAFDRVTHERDILPNFGFLQQLRKLAQPRQVS